LRTRQLFKHFRSIETNIPLTDRNLTTAQLTLLFSYITYDHRLIHSDPYNEVHYVAYERQRAIHDILLGNTVLKNYENTSTALQMSRITKQYAKVAEDLCR